MGNRKNVVESSKSPAANTSWEQYCHGNPYHIQNFSKYAFVDPKYFNSQLSHPFQYGALQLLVVDTKAFLNSLSSEEQQEYKQFIYNFVRMWSDDPAEDYSLCYVVGKLYGEDIKYFHIGIYSNIDNLPWEEKDIWLDKSMVDWMKEVKAYADTLKKVAVAA